MYIHKNVFSLFIFIGVLDTQPVHASTKASYTIKTIQEKKTYKKSSAAYLFQLPQLKGSSTAVKKINKSLKSEYQKSLTDKKRLFEYFNDFKRNGALDKNNWKLFSTTHCKETYNKNGYILFVFTSSWYVGGVHNSDTQTVIYRLKDGVKTNCGTQVKLSCIISGGLFVIMAYRFIYSNRECHNIVLKKLGDISFGIYFSHIAVMSALGFLPYYKRLTPYPINAIMVIIVTSLCVYLGKRILGKYAKYLAL